MTDENILVIGAGASGLMAARELAKHGKRVTILEAKSGAGGRILDIQDSRGATIRLGAEFIHGNLPLSLSLLREARLKYHAVRGQNYQSENGLLRKYSEGEGHWPELLGKMQELEDDMSLSDFLGRYFSGEEFVQLRASVTRFVEGYDAADPEKVSVCSLRAEWQMEQDEHYRIEEGYAKLIDFLEDECLQNGCMICYGKVISHFNWSEGFVEAVTVGGEHYAGQKAIITLPVGVLQVKDGGLGSVSFAPPLPVRMNAVRSMGFGAVVKVVLLFETAFWETVAPAAGFIFSDETIPTWWTQSPDHSAVLTGWLAGPKVAGLMSYPEEEVIALGLQSVANIFAGSYPDVRKHFLRGYAYNWANDPFSRGAYTYATLSGPEAPHILADPVEDVLFFSGEATYSGPWVGTVEAALNSGKDAAEKVLRSMI